MSTDQEIPVGHDQSLDDVFFAETVSPEGLRRVYHAALQRRNAVRASLQESIDLSRLEGAEEAYKRCYEDLSKLSETRHDDILRAVDSLREETKALRQTVCLGSAGEVSGGVLRAPGIPQRAPSLMRSPISQDSDSDLASALNDIKVRLDGFDRLGRPPSGGPPTFLHKQGPSSIPPQIDLGPRPVPSPSIQDGRQANNKDGISTQVSSVTPGTYTKNNWIATNKTPEPGDADTRHPGLPSYYNPGPASYSPENPVPEVSGLQSHSTMWVQFRDVVSYRAYRLNNIRANVRDSENRRIGKNVRRIKNLIPSLGNFDGSEPIALLKFPRALQEGFNTLRAPGGTAVRTMAFLLRGDANNFYESRSQSATPIRGGPTMSKMTWPRMLHTFIARYLTNDHLRTAYESVIRILQQPEDPQDGFARRIEQNGADCCQLFKDHKIVSYFIQGLLPRIRYTAAEQMKNFVEQERGSRLTAGRVSEAEGRSVRACFGDPGGRMRPIRSRDTTTTGGTYRASQNLVPIMYAGPSMDQCDSRGVPSSTTERTDGVTDFWETVVVANPVKKCCGRQDANIHAPVTGITPPSSGGSTAQTIEVKGRNWQARVPPVLTEEQMRQVWLFVPGDEAMYSC